VVYVEFLLAIIPVLVLFLGVCQLALVATAGAVVRHAAYAAARSAVVVLDDEPKRYGGAPRGNVSTGSGQSGAAKLFGALTELGLSAAPWSDEEAADAGSDEPRQQGARMGPIRSAAYVPLLVLAPGAVPAFGRKTLEQSVSSALAVELGFALAYTQSAAVVTLHTQAGTEALAREPIGQSARVTVRVSYLYACNVPLVRILACRTLADLTRTTEPPTERGQRAGELAARLPLAESSGLLQLLPADSRFYDVRAEVTLPNQGAEYDYAKEGG
jgi:hypothetical protein